MPSNRKIFKKKREKKKKNNKKKKLKVEWDKK